jgi:hypothetical protein
MRHARQCHSPARQCHKGVNARAEDYWTLRERFEQGEIDIDPDNDKLPPSWARSMGHRLPWTDQDRIEGRHAQARTAVTDRADAMAIAFAGKANAAPMNAESHAGESITGDLMTKAW